MIQRLRRLFLVAPLLGLLAACGGPAVIATPDVEPGQNIFAAFLSSARIAAGAGQVTSDPRLVAAAQAHATDMARFAFFDHRGSDGSDVADRVARAGYEGCFVAENIASGQFSEEAVFRDWMNSNRHRRNMESPRAVNYGLARDGLLWVLVLAAPC